uniref:Peroxisome assembly protein 12 n=1 Tax=Ditylenchus dipsaci TaxID=166011 RepID=A0A915DXL8_9BILA
MIPTNSQNGAASAAAFRAVHTGAATQSSSDVNSSQLPSIFDILAQESLVTSLKPGLRSIFKFILLCYPRARHLRLVDKFFDEIYTLFNLMIESHYLKRYSGSFSENFYGMKRVLHGGSGKPFTTFRQRLRSLFFLVLLPYLSEKLDKFREKLANSSAQSRTWLSHLFLQIYPHVKTILMVIGLLFQVTYTFSYSPIPSPWLYMAGVRLERLTPDDIQAFEAVPLHLKKAGLLAKLWRIVLSTPSVLGRLSLMGLAKQLFTMDGRMSRAAGQQVAPQHPYKAVPESYVLQMDVGKCPLCYRLRENDTALSVSGYVFCYGCINQFVRREKKW